MQVIYKGTLPGETREGEREKQTNTSNSVISGAASDSA